MCASLPWLTEGLCCAVLWVMVVVVVVQVVGGQADGAPFQAGTHLKDSEQTIGS